MKKHAETHPDPQQLVAGAQALLAATAHVAEDKVAEARKRLAACIEKGQETWEIVQQKGCHRRESDGSSHPRASLSLTGNRSGCSNMILRREKIRLKPVGSL
ncbi:MAG TPA: hypothetical protein VFC85_03370 [Verrucomicrobiae bacterium]|nr:hypothetical protein [Verrucomicrobiae bacterium]